MNKIKNYILTDKIFKNTYWGNYYDCEENIKNNRLCFKKNFKLKQRIFNEPKWLKVNENLDVNEVWDHIEIYKTKDNKYVVITSPYIPAIINKLHKILNNGFVINSSLYDNNCITFIKVYDIKNRRQINI